MAKTALGDIIGARFQDTISFAALTSAAAATVNGFGPFPHDIRVRGLYFTPLATGIAATQTASYRQYSLINPGPAGTLTATVASFNSSFATGATVASFAPTPIAKWSISTVASVQSVAAGSILYVTNATVGANEANGTVMPACLLSLQYEVV